MFQQKSRFNFTKFHSVRSNIRSFAIYHESTFLYGWSLAALNYRCYIYDTAIRTKHRRQYIIHNICPHLSMRTTRYTKNCFSKNHALVLQNFTHCAQNISFLHDQALIPFFCGCSLAALNYRCYVCMLYMIFGTHILL